MEDLRNIKVIVESLVPGTVVYNCEARHVRREWKRQGQQIPIPADELQEAIYDQGTYNLFTQGYLGIKNSAQRQLVGLEYEGTDEKIVPFSFENKSEDIERKQESCWLTYTNEKTHEIINQNLDRSPIYAGIIEGPGP